MSFKEAIAQAGLDCSPGKHAMQNRHRERIRQGDAVKISGSVDLDTHFQPAEPHANRWDYGVGFRKNREFVIWVEVHSASSSREVDVVIKKLKWLKSKLALKAFKQLAELTKAAPEGKQFCWLHHGRASFRSGGREQKRLAQHGMRLPTRVLEVG